MYRTGDLVRWSDAGLLEFIGRADDQVKINGHRVEPGEIESLLLQHEAVAQAAVAAHRDADGIFAGCLPGSEEGRRDRHRTRCAGFWPAACPTAMMPSSFTVLDAMPLTASGKLDRSALPAPAARPGGGSMPSRLRQSRKSLQSCGNRY